MPIFRDTTKKKKVLSLGNLKAPFKFMGGKTYCKGCKKKCSGEVKVWIHSHGGCSTVSGVSSNSRFCLYFLEVPLAIFFHPWLHSSCSMAHQPVELSRKLVTKPTIRANATLCILLTKNQFL